MFFVALSLTPLFMLLQAASTASAYCPDEPVAAAWYLDATEISWDKYNTVIYSFVTTTPDVKSLSLDGSDPSVLKQFVTEAHANGVAAHIAIGGWGGSRWFSSNVANPENRTAFVQTVTDFASQFKVDGINFDWEYPNHQGIGCNIINANDTENFLSFLLELRANSVGSQLMLSTAVSVTPFRDASGNPSKNVSGFADVLDYITIMNYDVWGPWSSSVGPNAPLNDTCVPVAYQEGSAVSAVEAWTAAGIPVNKIVLGVASYGHSFSVPPYDAFANSSQWKSLTPYPAFNASNQPLGDGGPGGVDVCGVNEKPGGTFTFKGLIDNGFLSTDGEPAPGLYYRFDNCSQTAYVYNKTSEVMVSFDDVAAFAAKGRYINATGLKGFSMWQAADDKNDLLLDSILSAAGIKTASPSKRSWRWDRY